MQHSSDPATLHLEGFLARYADNTRALYAYHLATYSTWCAGQGLNLFDASRTNVEAYTRHLADVRHYKPTSVRSAMSPVRTFYRLAHADGLIPRDPAAHAYRPRIVAPDHRETLDRFELIRWIGCARTITPRHNATAHLLGHLALRASETAGVMIEDYQHFERGYRVLRIIGKGNKPAMIPLPTAVLRALESARGDRDTGPLLAGVDGRLPTRFAITGIVETITRHSGIDKKVHPHMLRAAAVTAALDANVPLRDVQDFARHEDPKTTMGYDRNRGSLDRHAAHVVSAFLAS